MGHLAGKEYRDLEARYLDHKITKEQFLKIYRKPENYEVQHWKRNQSHMDEAGLTAMTDTSDRSNEDLQDLRFAAGEGDAEEFFAHYRSTDAADSELGRELLWDALRNGDDNAKTAIVTRLLDDGADPTWIHQGNTALHVLLAGNRHNAEVEAPLLAAMLERGADVNAVSPKDGTPLETIAARFKYTEADLKPYFDVILGRDDLDLLKTSLFGDTVLTNLRKWVDVRADLVARAEVYLTERDE